MTQPETAPSTSGATSYVCIKQTSAHKLGPIPAVYVGRQTCPEACPIRGLKGGCYAESGWHTRRQFDRATTNAKGDARDFPGLLEFVRSMPAGQLWRYGVSGDLPGPSNRIDVVQLRELTHASRGRRVLAYTHKPMDDLSNRLAVQQAVRNGFTINLSADNLAEADDLASMKIAPVVTLLPADAGRKTSTPAGRTVMTCPATYKPDVTCAVCRACAVPTRRTIIGFPAHGVQRARVDKVASANENRR